MVFSKFGSVVHYSALVNRFSQKMGEPEHFQQTKMPAIAIIIHIHIHTKLLFLITNHNRIIKAMRG